MIKGKAKMKYKIDKVILNSANGWKNFNDLRNDDKVVNAMKETANTIGEIETSYKAATRAHVITKVSKEKYDELMAKGVLIKRDEE